MPRFAANCSMLFTERPFLERFQAAAAAGFRAVEFQFPYAEPAARIRERLDAAGVQAVLHNLPAGDWAAGDRGLACDASRAAEFRAGVPQAIAYAQALGVPRLNLLAGRPGAGQTEAQTRALFLEQLCFAADALAAAGLTLLVEPINTHDVPGFWLRTVDQAAELLDAAGRDNVFIQADLYHMQRMGGDLAATLRRLRPRIGHVQFADNPGRHEPGTGELHFAFLFAELDRLGFDGWVGAEYLPSTRTEETLHWLKA